MSISPVKIFDRYISTKDVENILKKRKTVECEPATERGLKIKVNDIIGFSNVVPIKENRLLHCRTEVTNITYYASFEAFFKDYLAECLPDVLTIEEAVVKYHKIHGTEEEQKHGVVAFHIKLIE